MISKHAKTAAIMLTILTPPSSGHSPNSRRGRSLLDGIFDPHADCTEQDHDAYETDAYETFVSGLKRSDAFTDAQINYIEGPDYFMMSDRYLGRFMTHPETMSDWQTNMLLKNFCDAYDTHIPLGNGGDSGLRSMLGGTCMDSHDHLTAGQLRTVLKYYHDETNEEEGVLSENSLTEILTNNDVKPTKDEIDILLEHTRNPEGAPVNPADFQSMVNENLAEKDLLDFCKIDGISRAEDFGLTTEEAHGLADQYLAINEFDPDGGVGDKFQWDDDLTTIVDDYLEAGKLAEITPERTKHALQARFDELGYDIKVEEVIQRSKKDPPEADVQETDFEVVTFPVDGDQAIPTEGNTEELAAAQQENTELQTLADAQPENTTQLADAAPQENTELMSAFEMQPQLADVIAAQETPPTPAETNVGPFALDAGAILAIVIGAAVLLLAIFCGVLYCIRCHKPARAYSPVPTEDSEPYEARRRVLSVQREWNPPVLARMLTETQSESPNTPELEAVPGDEIVTEQRAEVTETELALTVLVPIIGAMLVGFIFYLSRRLRSKLN